MPARTKTTITRIKLGPCPSLGRPFRLQGDAVSVVRGARHLPQNKKPSASRAAPSASSWGARRGELGEVRLKLSTPKTPTSLPLKLKLAFTPPAAIRFLSLKKKGLTKSPF